MTLLFEPTPLERPDWPGALAPRRVTPVDPGLAAAFTASGKGGAARDRLLAGARCVTTGQQPGLFTGPLFTLYKALSTVALAHALERRWGEPVVPVFWIAGDDHDFAEANHCHVLNTQGDVERLELRARPPEAPLTPLYREPVGPEIAEILERLTLITPESEFRPAVLDWLARHYRSDADLSSAFGGALGELLGSTGLVVFQASHPDVKKRMIPWLRQALEQAAELDRALASRAAQLADDAQAAPVAVGDGATTVMLEGALGRDRLLLDGDGFTTRRAGERWTRSELLRLLDREPERFSPNVLLRPVVEAAILPTAAYVAGPGELAYLAQTEPINRALGVEPQARIARWSGRVIEARVQRTLDKFSVTAARLAPEQDGLEADLARGDLPAEARDALAALREGIESEYQRLLGPATGIDPTLKKPVESARNSALVGVADIEKRLIAHLKRQNEVVAGQLARARSALYPLGRAQERVLNVASFLVRYGDDFVAQAQDTITRSWGNLEPAPGGS